MTTILSPSTAVNVRTTNGGAIAARLVEDRTGGWRGEAAPGDRFVKLDVVLRDGSHDELIIRAYRIASIEPVL